MKRVSIYLRSATLRQAEPTVIDRQRATCEALVGVLGGKLVSVHSDAPGSGATCARPGLRALLAEADTGELDVVVVTDTTRLARNATDLAMISGRLRKAGVELRTVDNLQAELLDG